MHPGNVGSIHLTQLLRGRERNAEPVHQEIMKGKNRDEGLPEVLAQRKQYFLTVVIDGNGAAQSRKFVLELGKDGLYALREAFFG